MANEVEFEIPTPQDVIWLAGYLEGEGYFACCRNGGMKPSFKLKIQVGSVDEDVIRNATRILGAKRYWENGGLTKGGKRVFQTHLSGEKAARWMKLLYPCMSFRRKSQIDAAIKRWDGRPAACAKKYL